MEDNPSTKPGDLNVFMALSGSLTHPPPTQSYSWTKGAQRACFCFLSVCQHLMDSNGARHGSEVIREEKKQKKNKLGPRIMKTNPHCCQGVQAVFNQHIHIQGRCWKKGMRPSISLQSFKKTKLWIVWTSWSWMKRKIEGRGGQWPSMDQDIVFCDLKRPRWNSQPNICCWRAKCISARSKTSHMQHFMTQASSAHTVSA